MSIIAIVDADEDLSVTLASDDDSILSKSSESGFADHLGRFAEKKGLVFLNYVFSNVPSIACLNGCKVALVTFVWFFSPVCSQMMSQIVCIYEV